LAKFSTIKNKLVMTTALAAVMFGYGRRAYAACVVTVSPTYKCLGVTAAAQYIGVNEATVYTAAGFSLTTASSQAITITGDGLLSFTDVNASTIKGAYMGLYVQAGAPNDGIIPGSVTINANSNFTGTKHSGIFASNLGKGAVSITSNGTATGKYQGIYGGNYGTDLTITTGVGSTSTGTGTTANGIFARNKGSGILTLDVNGTATAKYFGILANNFGSDLDITTGASSSVTATTGAGAVGIRAYNYGTGAVTVTANGIVTGKWDAISVYNSGAGTGALTVNTGVASTITATNDFGIITSNKGSNATAITVNGIVTSKKYGINAYNSPASTSMTITTGVDSTVTSTGAGFDAIKANNGGQGALTIAASGTITGKNTGIYATNSAAGTDLTITTGTGKTVKGQTTYGIRAFNNGSGTFSITANGDVEGAASGIYARSFGTSGDLIINTAYNSTITGTAQYGINAGEFGAGALTISADGNVTGAYRGITTYNAGASLTISTGAGKSVIGATKQGIYAKNTSGYLSISAGGAVTGSTDGIQATNSGTNLTITTGAGSYITGTSNIGVYGNNKGAGNLMIDINGDVIGGWRGVYAYNYGGALTVTTATGTTVTGTGEIGIIARNDGGGALTITANGDVTGDNFGIYALNTVNTTDNLTIAIGQDSTVTSITSDGIKARNFGADELSITVDGNVTGAATGVNLRNGAASTDLTVNTGADSAVIGGVTGYGIFTANDGAGALSITTGGDVKGWYGGINANNYNPSSTSLTVTVDTGSNVTDMKFNGGVSVSNAGTGATTVNIDGYVWSADDGVIAHALAGNTGTLAITTSKLSTIIGAGDYGGAGYGIAAGNFGTGSVLLTINGDVSGGDTGISASNAAAGKNLTVTTGQYSSIIGTTTHGIDAENFGSGFLTVSADGDVYGGLNGINAYNKYGTNLAIATGGGGTVTGTNKRGIEGRNYGSSYLSITANGNVTGKTTGIWARNSVSGTNLTVNTGAGTTVTGTINYGIWARNYGDGLLSIAANGDITGYNGIYTRNYGTSLTVNTGTGTTVTGTNATGIGALNYGDSYLTITANGDVTGDNQGIYARNKGTDLTVTTGVGTTITASVATSITANNTTGTGAVLIDVAGDVTGRRGIYARNYINGTDLTVTTAAGTTITGTGPSDDGIDVSSSGSGPVLIDIGGDVSGAFSGIVASNNNAASAGTLTVTTETGTTVKGTTFYGIGAFNNSTNKLVINAYGNVSGGYSGITASNSATATDLTVITGAGTTIAGTTADGIHTHNNGTGDIMVTAGGAVSGGNYGIFARNESNSKGVTITTEAVSGGGDGIYARSFGSGALSITANDDITGGFVGIWARNSSSYSTDLNITTKAGSTVTGLVGNAIAATNFGTGKLTITTNGDIMGNSHGITASNAGTDLTITTQAVTSITGSGILPSNNGKGALTVSTYDDITGFSYGIYAQNSGTSLTIDTAAGTTVTGTNADGLRVKNKGSGALTITNLTTSLISGGKAGISALSGGGAYGIITNQAGATISGSTGIHVTGNALSAGGIDTTGTIKGTGGTAISLTGLSAATPITVNGGNIIGATIDDNPSSGYSPVTIAKNFTSEGDFDVFDFNVSKNAVFTLGKGFTISSYDTVDILGTFIIPADPTITGSVNVNTKGLLDVLAGTTITGDLQNNGTVSIATGTLVTADTMSKGTGTLSFGVTSVTDHGQLTLDNSPGYLTGQTVIIDVANVNGITATDEILLVDGNGALIGGPGKAGTPVDDNSLLWSFKIVDGAYTHKGFHSGTGDSDLYLIIDRPSSIEDIIEDITGSGGNITPNNISAAVTLVDLLDDTSNPELQDILDNFDSASTPAEVNRVLESVQPAEDGGSVVSTLTFVDNSINLTGERLNSLRMPGADDFGMTGLSAGGADTSDKRVWGQVSGQAARQRFREDIAGYDAALVAGTVGMDTENILENSIVGLAFSYGKTHIDSRNATRTDTDIDSYQATLYSDYDLGQGYYLNGMAGVAFNDHTTLRHDVGAIPGLNAYGDFSSWQVAAKAETGRSFYVGYGTFTPMALVNWVYYNADDYTETGAGGASLHVRTESLNQLDLGLGARISGNLTNTDGARTIPEIHASYRREMIGDKLETLSAFAGGGPAFSGESPAPAQNKFNIGAQVKYYSVNNLELTASYDLDARPGFMSHAGLLRAGWKF
jgi:uncharacterized protein with beta-barrel porin domain